jgi:hypothetical protein
MPPSSTGLSAVPSVATANSFTGVGAASTSTDPTTTTVPACGRPSSAATSSATAAPDETAITPASAGNAFRFMPFLPDMPRGPPHSATGPEALAGQLLGISTVSTM